MLTVNAGVLRSARTIEFMKFKVAERLEPGFVKVSTKHLSICGSDVDYWKYNGDVPSDFLLIHEAGGVVTEVGSDVASVKPGDLVWVNPLWADPSLPFNERLHELGLDNLIPLPHHKFLATPPVQGVLRDTIIYPAHLLHKIEGGASNPERIPLIEPLACSYNGVDLLNMQQVQMFGEWTATVIGPGPIGIMCAAILLNRGCSKVFLLGRTEGRLKKAKQVLTRHFEAERIETVVSHSNPQQVVAAIKSKTPYERGVDVVMECSGDEDVVTPAMVYMSPMGQLIEIGRMLHGIKFDRPHGQRGQKTFQFSYRFNRRAIEESIQLLFGPDRFDIDDIVTNRFPLQRSAEAFALAAQKPPEVIKILIECPN